MPRGRHAKSEEVVTAVAVPTRRKEGAADGQQERDAEVSSSH